MKVLLFDIKSKSTKKVINKDLAGGMGTGTWIGNSLRARLFEWVKKRNVILPILSTVYLASIFKRSGWEVRVIEVGSVVNLHKDSVDLALVPTSIVDWRHELEVIRNLKKQGIYVGIYGTLASTLPELYADEVDFIIKGEPEAGALKIVASKQLPSGILEVNPIENLDELPFPDWSQFPIKKYSYFPALNKKPLAVMLSSRGCPHSCSYYCPYTILSGRHWRARSVGNVIEEIEYLKKKYGVKAIDFRDPIFTLDRKRVLDFSNSLIERKLDIIWSCETRLDCLDKELIKTMHAAGLRNINVGIESSDIDVLEGSKRLPINYIHQEEIISFCQKLGINIAAFYILGLEKDTEESIKKTISYAQKLNTLVAQFAINTPYPGTAFFENLKNEGRLINFDWEDYDEYTLVFKHKFLNSQKLLALKEQAFVSYYFRPAYLLKHFSVFLRKFL